MTAPKRQRKETYFPITFQKAREVRAAKLTAAEWRFWSLLITLDPFGDGAKFDPAEVMLECGFSKSTYFAAKAKLQSLGFDFTDGATRVINRSASKKLSKNSESHSDSSDRESDFSESHSDSSDSESDFSESHSEKSDSPVVEKLISGASESSQTNSNCIQTNSSSSQTNPERERDARAREEEQQAVVENLEPEQAIALSTQAPSTGSHVKPKDSGEEDRSAAAPIAASFSAEAYDWKRYRKAGDGGSDPRFLDYMVNRTRDYSDRRVETGGEVVGDLNAYALKRIRNDGLKYYQDFEVAEGLRSPEPKPSARASPKAFVWTDWETDDAPSADISVELSDIKLRWVELKLGWDDPRWLAWLQQAQEHQAFEWQKGYGFAYLPDWAVRKLAHDMQAGGR